MPSAAAAAASPSVEIQEVKDILDDKNFNGILKTANEVFDEAFALYNEPGFESYKDWKKETETDNSTIHTRQMPYGKLFALRATIPWDYESVFHEQWNGLDTVATWNENIVFSSTLKKINENIDIVHYANKDVLMVKSRDYVAVRKSEKISDSYYLIARSIDFPDLPETKDRVRAIIHLGAGRYRQHPDNSMATQVDLMLSIDFGGYIPKSVINAVMGKLLIKDFEETRKHLKSLQESVEYGNNK
uniref:START domain-containing protein n=1 Tax=Panagrolaimus sp. PS1159 TaxID=55785 RepID=A0AC35GEQ8_9BILA